MNVAAWLQRLGLERYEPLFRDNEIDWEVLPKLTLEDLKEIGVVAIGHRRRLLDAIAALRAEVPVAAETAASRDAAPPVNAERRHLSVHATTLTPLAREPEVNSNVSTIDLLSHLEGAPFMGSFEARYGNLGFLADAIHLPVSTKISTHDIFFQGGNAALKADTGTGIALYRFLADPVQFADGGLGFRAWGFSSNISLNPGLLPGVSVNPSGSWTDPLIGARYHRDLGNGFALTAYGDVGGFGVGAHTDWQVLGTVDYSLSPSWNLHLGYRSLNFNITGSEGRFGFNVHMRGPILAGTFRF